MSRSRKKNPIYKYAPSSKRGGAKLAKRMANKKIRRSLYLSNGKYFRKVYQTWDIHDIVSRWTWEMAQKKEFTYNYWAKLCLRK